MRFKNGPQLPGAGRSRAGHHHGSHTPTSPGTISLGKIKEYPEYIGHFLLEFLIPVKNDQFIQGTPWVKWSLTPNKSAGSVCIFTSQVAEIMNEHFINVKVDREERPDVDKGCKTFQPRIFQPQNPTPDSTSTMNLQPWTRPAMNFSTMNISIPLNTC